MEKSSGGGCRPQYGGPAPTACREYLGATGTAEIVARPEQSDRQKSKTCRRTCHLRRPRLPEPTGGSTPSSRNRIRRRELSHRAIKRLFGQELLSFLRRKP